MSWHRLSHLVLFVLVVIRSLCEWEALMRPLTHVAVEQRGEERREAMPMPLGTYIHTPESQKHLGEFERKVICLIH